MIPFTTFAFAPHLATQTVVGIFFVGAIVFAVATIVLYRTHTIQWLVLCVTCASVPLGMMPIVNVYLPYRYFNQYLYEQTLALFEVIDQRYDSFSLDDFRLWYSQNDQQTPIFWNLSGTYLWSWGRRIGFEGITLTNSFTVYDIITLASVESNDAFVQQIRNLIERDRLEVVQFEEVRVVTAFNETVMNFIIRFDVINSLEEAVVNSLSLTLNGELLTLTRTGNRYEAIISGELLNAPTIEFIFQTDRVSNPFDLGIQDGRKLGVALGELTIAPIADDE